MFDWNDVRHFLAIVRGGSLSAAARQLSVRQSTVGRRLAALEHALGARLFQRTPSGYVLTVGGQSLLQHAEVIEARAFAAERELLGRDRRVAGKVRLTAPQAFGNGFVAPLLARLRAEHPGILVELIAENSNLSLTKRDADIALRLGRPREAQLVVRKLADVGNGFYASTAYLETHGRPTRSLRGQEVIVFDDTYQHKPAVAWLAQRASGTRCALKANSSHGIHAAVLAGMGIAVLPCWLGGSSPGVERVLPAEELVQALFLVVHRDMRSLPRIRVVSEFLLRELSRAAPILAGRISAPSTPPAGQRVRRTI